MNPTDPPVSNERTHVDFVRTDPMSALPDTLIRRTQPDDPEIGKQAKEGSATYVYVSEPHTMAECPFSVSNEAAEQYVVINTIAHADSAAPTKYSAEVRTSRLLKVGERLVPSSWRERALRAEQALEDEVGRVPGDHVVVHRTRIPELEAERDRAREELRKAIEIMERFCITGRQLFDNLESAVPDARAFLARHRKESE